MPNLLFDFTKGFASTIAPQSLTDLKSDAKEIYSAVIGGAQTAQEKYREISRKPFFRKVTRFFTQRSSDFAEGSSLEDKDADDEFDAGFNFGGDEEESPSSKVLDSDSMKGIVRGQVSSMYEIAGKQAEASALNASEIITTINTRASEVLSSLGGINKSLQIIGEKLDKIIELSVVEKRRSYDDSSSLFGSDGNLTFGSTYRYLMKNLPYKDEIEIGKNMFSMFARAWSDPGVNKAEMLGSLIGMGTDIFENKSLKILGDRSINDIREAVDERVSNAQNELLSKLLDWGKFKHLFGNLNARESGKDYSTFIENQYDTNKAVFDNMTRKTIIDIIPGYLRRITAALTGQNLFISSEGSLTTERESGFKQVFNSTINSGFNDKKMQQIIDRAGENISRDDIFMAQRVLVSLYVFRELQTAGTRTKADLFEDGGDPETNKRAIDLLTQKGGHDREYWTKVIESITAQLITDKQSRSKFAQTIRQTADSTDQSAERYAKTATITYDIKAIDDDLVNDVVGGYIERTEGKDDRTWNERVKAGEIKRIDIPVGVDPDSRASDEELKRVRREKIRQSDIIGDVGKSFREINTTTIDYLASIFAILNRGINVYPVRHGPFGKMGVQKTKDEEESHIEPTPVKEQDKESKEEEEPTSDIESSSDAQKTKYVPSRRWSVKQTTSTSDEETTDEETEEETETHVETQSEHQQRTKEAKDDQNKMPSIEVPDSSKQPQQQSEPAPQQTQTPKETKSWKDTTHDFIQKWIKNPFEQMRNNIQTDLKTMKSMTADTVNIEYNKDMAKYQTEQMGDSEDDKHDKAIADAVLAAMNAATADGDTQEDIAPLMSQISEIKDPKLKSRLTKVVEGTLQRSENKKPAQSRIGKILTWGFGLVKGFVLPVLSKAKMFITTWGKALISPILKSLKSSGQKIARGAKAVGQGLFGSDESRGIFGRVKDKITDAASSAKEKIDAKLDQKLQQQRVKELQRTLQPIDQRQQQQQTQPQQQTEQKKDNAFTRMTNNIKEKMQKSEFGQGFISAFEKKANVEKKPETLADQMSKSINDILKSKDGTGSVFGTIINKITSIGDVFKNGMEELNKKKEEQKQQKEQQSQQSSTTQTRHPTMESINIPNSSTTETQSSTTETQPSTSTPATSGGDASASSGEATGGATKKKGIGFDLGKILGGITGMLGGLLQAVMTVVMGMAGFKKIMTLVSNVLKRSLRGLNKAFNSIYKAIKPIMKKIQNILKEIVDYVVEIIQSVIEIIQPILEFLGPIIEQLMETLKPILDMLTDLVNVLLVPLVAQMDTILFPTVQAIANLLEEIFGILEVGIGTILMALSGLIIIVGGIAKIFGSDSLLDTGLQLAETSKTMVVTGAKSVYSAVSKSYALMSNGFQLESNTPEEEKTIIKSTPRERTVDTLNGSPMDGIYAAGDVPTIANDINQTEIYGGAGANQNRYGNYMNMGQRGCGPIALADAYARRSGTSVNARGLTSAMASSGTYSPTMGTSVGGFMSASSSMGMNLRAGGVTPASLKQATPHNPITIIGSGTDFTTRKGNNHYMNVVGSSGGTAFVSNPMNGRIERRSITSLAANSVMGLYGSGDAVPPISEVDTTYGSGDAGFQISDAVQDALTTLKELVQSIVNIFTGEESVADTLNSAKKDEQYKKSMVDAGVMTEEDRQKLESEAMAMYKAEEGRYEGETDAEFEKRFQNDEYYKHYMTKAATQRVQDEVKRSAGSEEGTAGYLINQTLGDVDPETGQRKGGFADNFMSTMTTYDKSIEKGSFFNKLQEMVGDGYWEEMEDQSGFYSDNGARLYTDEYEPTVFDTSDAVNWRASKGDWIDVPLVEWLKHTMPGMGGMSSAWKRYGPPANDQVEGLAGSNHNGTDLYGPEGTPIRATTDGVVIGKGTDSWGGGAGYYINIEDIGKDVHQYFHMMEPSQLEIGDEVYGGDVIGKVGNTGHSFGAHLHYQIKSPDGIIYNPHTFFKWHEGMRGGAPYGPIKYEGELEDGDIWNYHKNKTGVSKFMKTAFEAGLTGPEVATVTSTGIWEDGGEKLWGTKSLLNTTYDYNGQQAVGIMNWMDTNVDYGDTVEEQLQYIQRTYFDEDSNDVRGTVRHNDYDAADLAAFKQVTGRKGWELDWGDKYGPYMNTDDLIEGSEHFFRGALVPACIHVPEGPRKYIGTAVGVYNWLLDEGYISQDDGRSRVWRSTKNDDWYPTEYYDDSEYIDVTGTAAGNTVANNQASLEDKKSGIPVKFSSTSTGTKGTAYNAAGQILFDYWVIAGVDQADRNCKFKNTRKMKLNMNGTFRDVWIDIDSFPQTYAGDNARKFVNDGGTYYEATTIIDDGSYSSTSSSNQQTQNLKMLAAANSLGLQWKVGSKDGVPTYDGWTDPSVNVTMYHSTRDWATNFWKDHGYSAAPNWDDHTMGIKFSSAIYKQGTGVNEGSDVLKKNKSMLKVFDDRGIEFWDKMRGYPNTKSAMEAAGIPTSQSYWYQKAGQTYDKYYKGINTAYSSSGYYGEYPFKTWGGGDSQVYSNIVLPGQISDMLSTDTYMDTASPVIVNKYEVPNQDVEMIEALMSNTYNVRSEEIEQVLTSMLTLMRERNQQREQKRSAAGRSGKSSKKKDAIFPEQGIPRQIERLSVG